MRINAGVWLDHREAVVVVLSETGEATTRIQSGAEKHATRSSPPSEGKFKGHQAPADDSRENEFQEHLARYYDQVVASLRDADSILIFGPGEAKGELHKRFERQKSDARRIAVESAEQLSGPQVAARVRDHFLIKGPARR